MKQKKTIFYGWIIVAFGVLYMGVTHGLVNNCFSQFVIPVSEELGLPRERFSLCATIISVLYVAVSLLSGRIYRRIPVLLTMRIAAVGLPVCYFCFSLCRSLAAFYACAVLCGLFTALSTFLPYTLILNAWFEEKRGLAIGMCFMGTGLGGMVLNELVTSWIASPMVGWRAGYCRGAVIMAAIMIPVSFLVLKESPEKMGLKPLGAGKNGNSEQASSYGPTVKQALRLPEFWILIGIAAIVGIFSNVLGNMYHLRLPELGYDGAYAGRMMSIYLVLLAASKVFLGGLSDQLGEKRSVLLLMAVMLVAACGLLFARSPAMVLVWVICSGVSCSTGTMAYPLLTRYTLGNRDYTSLYGIVCACGNLTSAFTLVIANAVYTSTGSYDAVGAGAVVMGIVQLVLILLLKPASKQHMAEEL